jgi:hypothetical protein
MTFNAGDRRNNSYLAHREDSKLENRGPGLSGRFKHKKEKTGQLVNVA